MGILALTMMSCGALWPTEPSGVKIDVDKNEGTVIIEVSDDDVLIGTNGPTGDITVNTGDGQCCEDDVTQDLSRCWSTCQSKNVLEPEECAACARGERECIWPWEVDYECLQE